METVDTHAHIQGEDFNDDRPEALARAAEAGVRRIVAIGADMPTSEAAVILADAEEGVIATVGVHPHDAKTFNEAQWERLKALAARPKVRAIGEIGLDYHYDFSPRPAQQTCFQGQIALAAHLGLPAVIHMREAEDDVYHVLKGAMAANGPAEDGGRGRIGPVIMHCFLGGPAEAERWLALGCYLGIGGAVTFKKMDALREAVKAIPLDRLLLETDCPYMTPAPHRGQRNEPAYIPLVCAAVAKAKGLSEAEVAAATTLNAEAVFGRW
ncbi:MAG TPA: TatD family hydrolase [Armatimonadota bacterium]|jgi:TatD DNase family protein